MNRHFFFARTYSRKRTTFVFASVTDSALSLLFYLHVFEIRFYLSKTLVTLFNFW